MGKGMDTNIKFGTDGWRAIVGKDFNHENVEIVTKAIAQYILEQDGINKPVIIGYDPRNMAKEFAQFSAEVLANAGFKVTVSSEVVPTPVLAFNARYRNADALMFTASHNPPEYLGIKYIPDYAGPATTKITNAIMENIKNIDSIEFKSLQKPEIKYESFKEPYFKHIESIINFEKIKEYFTREDDDGEIVYDGLYSASIGYFDELLKRNGISCETLHMHHDSNFGGGMPEPKAKYLSELIDLIARRTSAIGLSNDGDGDRFGVINEKAEFVTPNEIIALLLGHLINNKKNTRKYKAESKRKTCRSHKSGRIAPQPAAAGRYGGWSLDHAETGMAEKTGTLAENAGRTLLYANRRNRVLRIHIHPAAVSRRDSQSALTSHAARNPLGRKMGVWTFYRSRDSGSFPERAAHCRQNRRRRRSRSRSRRARPRRSRRAP